MGGDNYAWYKSHGICTDCHANDAEKGHNLCTDCRLKALSRSAEYRSRETQEKREKRLKRQHEYAVSRYHSLKQAGICVDCGKREAVNNVRCPICRYLNNIRRRRYLDYQRGDDR